MSTERIEAALKNKPKPGEVGGQLVGYAEAERQQKVDVPVQEFYSKDEITLEAERLSGKSIGEMTEQDFMKLPVILKARETQNMTELHVVFKDPSMTGRWFNWKTKTEDRVGRAYMAGYTACTKDDVEACHIKQSDENGSLVYGDLVLLKIPKAVLWSKYKQNMDTAVARVERASSKVSPSEGVPNLPNGASFEGSMTARQMNADLQQVNKARELVYAE